MLASLREAGAVPHGEPGPFLNEGGGASVITHFRPSLEDLRTGPLGLCERVESDVGPLWFPRFDQFMRRAIAATGRWEPEETAFLARHVPPGATVVNVGANVGYLSLALSRIVGPTGRVVAIEPEPLNFQLLAANLLANSASNVLPIHTAAGEFTGSITLQRSPDNAGDHRTAPHPVSVGSVGVPIVTLDALIPSGTKVDAVVSDAQGYDHRIMAGMAGLVARERPFVMAEFWPPGILELGDDPAAVLEGYAALGTDVIVVTTGDVVTGWPPSEIIRLALDGRDHVTLALVP
jgi:FkbM family methyltransferase